MNNSSTEISRRGVLRALAGGGALMVAAATAGCGSDQSPEPTGNLVMIIRSAEEAPADARALSDVGRARASALASLFAPPGRLPKAGLDRPAAVYACAPADQRAPVVDTVTPLAQRLRLTVITDFDDRQTAALVKRVVSQPGPTVICARNSETPTIARGFAPVNTTPPDEWPANRFDVVWVLTQTTDGWLFTQIPELVLPGDQTSAIS